MKYRKQLRIRITIEQYRKLIDRVKSEQSTPSSVVRDILDKSLKKNYNPKEKK